MSANGVPNAVVLDESSHLSLHGISPYHSVAATSEVSMRT
jgi:hypothetical protein